MRAFGTQCLTSLRGENQPLTNADYHIDTYTLQYISQIRLKINRYQMSKMANFVNVHVVTQYQRPCKDLK